LIATQWGTTNFFHCLYDAIAKISVLNKFYDIAELNFLLPDFVKWYQEFFDIFNLKYSLYSINTIYKGNFIVPSMPSRFGHPSYDVCTLFKSLSNKLAVSNVKYKYIYIARRQKRAIINEVALLDFLQSKFEFQKLYFEDLSMFEQLTIFSNAEIVVAPHGAGLGWCAFQKKGALVEIHGPYLISLSYQTISLNNRAIKYYPFFCDPERTYHSSVDGKQFENYNIDLDRFETFFNEIYFDSI
jgi:capsular polysaccharide biosynthesis protein